MWVPRWCDGGRIGEKAGLRNAASVAASHGELASIWSQGFCQVAGQGGLFVPGSRSAGMNLWADARNRPTADIRCADRDGWDWPEGDRQLSGPQWLKPAAEVGRVHRQLLTRSGHCRALWCDRVCKRLGAGDSAVSGSVGR